MKLFLPVIFFLVASPSIAQDVTGVWRGYFNETNYRKETEGTIFDSRYKFEVQLAQKGNRFDGVTYSYRSSVFYGKATANGTVNFKTKKILLDELKIVEVRMSGLGATCIMRLFLQYSKSGDEELLEGTYDSMNTSDSMPCGRGTVFLRRVVTSDFPKEPFVIKRENEIAKEKEKASKIIPTSPDNTVAKNNPVKKPPVTKPTASNTTAKKNNTSTASNKPTTTTKKNVGVKPPPVVTNTKPLTSKTKDIKIATLDSVNKIERTPLPVITPKVLATRENEVVKTIFTKSNEITINVYDNGSIDNDTVSVYLDKKLVISKQRLTTKAITFKFLLDDTNDYHELVMVAENLGEIPPNTSLMVVNAGNKQYEVRITSNEQKNAVVIFKYEKEK